ncbi:MAG: leucine-rich repeat domain-containing protein, partial [Clostridiales bacterium]|nr:leucine-rich repeat domain-containing protein [Clostridiales bacterium]
IPYGYDNDLKFGAFTLDIIKAVEANPDVEFGFNFIDILTYANNVRNYVNDYYGVSQYSIGMVGVSKAAYILQDNLVKNSNGDWVSSGGAWDDSWENYNCYAFAIEKTQNVPEKANGFFAYDPGYFSGSGSFYSDTSIYDLAMIVKDDLTTLGYIVEVSNIEPNTIASNESLICVRRGYSDYHFMRKNFIDGFWYHKPGSTAPLKYLHHPADKDWVCEVSKYGNEGYGGIIYDSEIYYITYSYPFTFTLTNNQVAITGVKDNVILHNNIEIPNVMNINDISYPVISIGANAFLNCTSLQNVTFEAGSQLTSIGYNAFASCINLSSIKIPSSVTSIGSQAFIGCSNLEMVILCSQTTIPSLGTNAFNYTYSGLQIYVPYSLENAYKTATNWNSYANKIEGCYIENDKAYVTESGTVNVADQTELVTLYSYNLSDVWADYGEHLYGEAFIAVGGSRVFYVDCSIDCDYGEMIECSLKIEVEATTSCILINSDKQFVAECFIEDGILTVPYLEIYNSGEGFYLLPIMPNGQAIEFVPSDISLEYTARIYV